MANKLIKDLPEIVDIPTSSLIPVSVDGIIVGKSTVDNLSEPINQIAKTIILGELAQPDGAEKIGYNTSNVSDFLGDIENRIADSSASAALAEGYANEAIAAAMQSQALVNEIAKNPSNALPVSNVEFAGLFKVVLNGSDFFIPFYRSKPTNAIESLSLDFLNGVYEISKAPALQTLSADFKNNAYQLDVA